MRAAETSRDVRVGRGEWEQGQRGGLLTHDVVVDVAVALVGVKARPVAEEKVCGVVADLVGAVGDGAEHVLDQVALQTQQTLEELHIEG